MFLIGHLVNYSIVIHPNYLFDQLIFYLFL